MSEGIWGHSSGATTQHVIFASKLHDFLVRDILLELGIKYKELRGSYKGVEETAWLVSDDDFGSKLFGHALLVGEESVLVLGSEYDARDRRKATLRFFDDGTTEEIGWFGSTTESDARGQDGWTYDPSINGGTWFTVKRKWPQAVTVDCLACRAQVQQAVGAYSR